MVEKKGGELGELKSQLRNLAASQIKEDVQVKRDIFKKVIAYMSINIDVSSLFTEMTMATVTSDIALKKMLYHYITHHAHCHPDLALLAINTLLKDCRDEDPTIRGLALRSLCSLRVPILVEYLTEPLQRALGDSEAYVRRTAVMGVLKLHHLEPDVLDRLQLKQGLRGMLTRDADAQVVANCISVLGEMEGFDSLAEPQLLIPTLNRIREFNEWGICLVLQVAAKMTPNNESEVYDMMNMLEGFLSHANSAVVLATVKVFLHLTLSLEQVHQQVYERIKAPIFTLMSSSSQETAYAVVSHLVLLVDRAPILFSSDFKQFYCRYSDPAYIKLLKLQMLVAVADSSNVYDIVTEIGEYVSDVDPTIACKSIQAIGNIILNTPDAEGLVSRLLSMLELGQEHLMAETLVQMKDLLRRLPQHTPDITSALALVSLQDLTHPAAKAAYLWMVGELGVSDPYALEPLVESFVEEESSEVLLSLLTTCMKLFFKRPPECQRLLGQALQAGAAHANQDVHDRALMYYRLLRQDVEQARAVVVSGERNISGGFTESQTSELNEALFHEFNSLSVLYRTPKHTFAPDSKDLPPIPLSPTDVEEGGGLAGVQSAAVLNPEADLLGDEIREEEDSSIAPPEYTAPDPLAALIDLGNGEGPAVTPTPDASLTLIPHPSLDAPTFQAKWGALEAHKESLPLTPSLAAVLTSQGAPAVKAAFASSHLQTMASGGASPQFKFFFYAQPGPPVTANGHLLVELILNTSTLSAALTVKSDLPQSCIAPFFDIVKTVLGRL